MNHLKPQALTVERDQPASFTLRDQLSYFLRLGTFGFGGPIALAAYMQKDLVEERHWVSKSDYLEGLAFSQLSPGPLAAQLAMYIGWLRSGVIGATFAVSKDWLLGIIFAALAITTAWTQSEIVWLLILSGFVAMFIKAPPQVSRHESIMFFALPNLLFAGIHGLASAATVVGLFLFFLKAGAFVFGSGLAIVPFLYGGVVVKFHWLTERQFIDAVT